MSSASAIVDLDVGGTTFRTFKSTLEAQQNFFSSLLRRHILDDTIFIDRDPTHFRHVLNWLRGSTNLAGLDTAALAQVATEADFYSMTDLAEEARRQSKIAELNSVTCAIRELACVARQ